MNQPRPRGQWRLEERNRYLGRSAARNQRVSYMSRSLAEALMSGPRRTTRRAPESQPSPVQSLGQRRTTSRAPDSQPSPARSLGVAQVQPRSERSNFVPKEDESFATKVLDFLTMKDARERRAARRVEEKKAQAEQEAARLREEVEKERMMKLLGSYASRHDNATSIAVTRIPNAVARNGTGPIPSRFADFGRELDAVEVATRRAIFNPTLKNTAPAGEPERRMEVSSSKRKAAGANREDARAASQTSDTSRLEQLVQSYGQRKSPLPRTSRPSGGGAQEVAAPPQTIDLAQPPASPEAVAPENVDLPGQSSQMRARGRGSENEAEPSQQDGDRSSLK